jgi:16S rRNA (guanine(966)-N(2))-methyltransferase RsmD
MRIIAGQYRSRVIQSLPGVDVRPTSDRMRETLFNVLGPSLAGQVFVDAYAGTGAVGIEALSRGARLVVFIEKGRDVCELIKANLASLKIGREGRLMQGSAALQLTRVEADVVFIDPPYPKEREYEASMEALQAKPPALVVVQHSSRFALPEEYGKLKRTRVLKQGENTFSFYRPAPKPAEPASDPTIDSEPAAAEAAEEA